MTARVIPKPKALPTIVGKPHSLKPNKSSPRPSRMFFLDTETKVAAELPGIQYQEFQVGVSCFHRRRYGVRPNTEAWKVHDTPESLCAELESRAKPKRALYVFGSNPSFDLWVLGFYTHFAERGWKCSFVYDEGMRFILVIKREGATIKVLALQNYFSVGIKELGEWLGKPKGECNPLTDPLDKVTDYCIRDVEILRDGILGYIEWCDRSDVGGWSLTIGSQAMTLLRHRYLDAKVWVHRKPKALELERMAYYGARTEAFYIGTPPGGPFVNYDVNSLYPFVMAKYPYPVNLRGMVENPTIERAKVALRSGCVIAEVTLDVSDPLWCVRYNDRACFPTGRIRTFVCSMGLSMAIATGSLVKIHRMTVYKRAFLFRRLVNDFYPMRAKYKSDGDTVMEKAVRLLLNSLYGKFGEAPPMEVSRTEVDDPGFYRELIAPSDGGEAIIRTQIMHRLFVQQGRKEGKNALPSIAAHVTEYGRFHLAYLMALLPPKTVHYCDTDSIIIPTSASERLTPHVDATRLGALANEGESDHFVIHGAKDYEFGEERKIKGIARNAPMTDKGTFELTVFPSLKRLLRNPVGSQIPQSLLPTFTVRDVLDIQKARLFPVLTVEKTLDRTYQKGQVGKSGWVKPYVLSEADCSLSFS